VPVGVAKLHCRGCGKEMALPIDGNVPNPNCYTCAACNGNKSMLDNMSRKDIAKSRLAKQLSWQRRKQRKDNVVCMREDRERKFRERNGFTLQAWFEKVDASGWRCSFCGCKLTKDPGTDNSVVRWSQDDSKSLEKMIPVCRACQCKKIGPLARL
jgi:hypothetical protein